MTTPNIVKDINEFFWGEAWPSYLIETQTIRIGSEKNFKRALIVYWYDPTLIEAQFYKSIGKWSSITNQTVLTDDHLSLARIKNSLADKLCCESAILEHGVGHGCARDIDLILQEALFEEVVYG